MEEIAIVGTKGRIVARNNLLLCFFGQTSVRDWAAAGAHCLQEWLRIIPNDALAWTLIGASASQYAPMNARSLARCQAVLDAAKAKSKLQSFEVLGPDRYMPDFSIAWKADPDSHDAGSQYTNFVEMRFPASFLDQHGSTSLVEWATALSQKCSHDSGYAAISLVSHEAVAHEAGKPVAALALRHYGYDVSENRGTSFFLGRRSRGPQWLTFLGASLLKQLGGRNRVLPALSEYNVSPAGTGMAIVTSPVPDIGDTNRKKQLQHLRPLAALLEPVTYFGDRVLNPLFMNDEDKRERWERRFLD